jgi:hypothetical protein
VVFIVFFGWVAHIFFGYDISLRRYDYSYYFIGLLDISAFLLIFNTIFEFFAKKSSFRTRLAVIFLLLVGSLINLSVPYPYHYFALGIILLLVFNTLFEIISGKILFIPGMVLILSFISLFLIGGFLYVSSPYSHYHYYAWGIIGLLIIILASIAIDSLIFLWSEHKINKEYPESIVIYNIVLVLHWIEKEKGKLGNLWFKQNCAIRLEYVAKSIENYVSRRLSTSDTLTNEWIKETTAKIAAGLREKKKWIFTPKSDTTKYLMKNLLDFLTNFMNSNWDALEKVEVPKETWQEFWKSTVLSIAGKAVFGLLPVSILLLLRYLDVISRTQIDPFFSVAVLWAVVSLIWADPQSKDKVSAMKDISGLIYK